jgi:hypothetical protein
MVANKIYSSQEFTETDIQKLNLNDEDLIERLCDEGIWINSELSETLKSYVDFY